ncbi:MAG: DUF721 domain-containing protein [Oligoflexia bacterium]|nr:DUF721 domain-containing protein [Oligoflexia bacterium]
MTNKQKLAQQKLLQQRLIQRKLIRPLPCKNKRACSKGIAQILNGNPISEMIKANKSSNSGIKNKYSATSNTSSIIGGTGKISRIGGIAGITSLEFIKLTNSWKEIVGDALAQNTAPGKIQQHQLIIYTKHSTYSHQLTYLVKEIKEKIHMHFPSLKKAFSEIKFITQTNFFQKKSTTLTPISSPLGNSTTTAAAVAAAVVAAENREKFLHPHSPHYKKAQREAAQQFANVQDEKIRNLLISICLKIKLAPDKWPKDK